MSKYNFGSNSSTSGNNSSNHDFNGYPTALKIGPFVKMEGELDSLFVGNSDWGQSIAVTYLEGKLVDGILTTREDKDQYKVFSWNDAPVIEDEDLDCDDLPAILTKTYGGSTYNYKILAARLEGDEDVGYSDDVDVRNQDYDGTDPVPVSMFFEDDAGTPDTRFTVYESAGEHGPSSCAKTTAKVLSSKGHNAVVDENSQHEWLADNISLREELEGMEITYAKVQRESNESDNSFHFPIFIDKATGEMIVPDNSNDNETEQTAPEPEPQDDPDESPTDSTTPVDEFYDTCDELDIDTEPAVLGLLDDMVEDEDNELAESMIDRDEIVSDLVA